MAGGRWWLALLSVFMLGFGGLMLTWSYRDQQAYYAMLDHGREVEADIVDAFGKTNRGRTSYVVKLAWADRLGQVQTYPPTHVSPEFWRTISDAGVWTVKMTRIRYLEGENVRPLILGDSAEREHQDWFGIRAGLAFLLVGLGCGVWLMRGMRGA